MKNFPKSTIDITAGSKGDARHQFFSHHGATIEDDGHTHVYSVHSDIALVTDMKLDESGAVIEDSIQQNPVTPDEAFDLFWLMANKGTPKKLLLATFAAICKDPTETTEQDRAEHSATVINKP